MIIVIVLIAVVGGALAFTFLLSMGLGWALLAIPFGGSAAVFLAAVLVGRQSAADRPAPARRTALTGEKR